MRPLTIIAALWASTANAESVAHIGIAAPGRTPSTVELHAPTAPAARATLTFTDRDVNHFDDDGSYTVIWDGIEVHVVFEWSGSGDIITVLPPAGMIARPERVQSPHERAVSEVQIYEWIGG